MHWTMIRESIVFLVPIMDDLQPCSSEKRTFPERPARPGATNGISGLDVVGTDRRGPP